MAPQPRCDSGLGTPYGRSPYRNTPSKKGKPRREAGTQSHGSGREPDSRATEGGVVVTPREHGGLPQGRPRAFSTAPVLGGFSRSVSRSGDSSWSPPRVKPGSWMRPGPPPPRIATEAP